jgi:molecular chaperone DnaK
VSLLELGEGVIEVKATSGDNHLGGDDWDQRVIDHLVKTFRGQHGIDLSTDKMAMQRLREAAEKAEDRALRRDHRQHHAALHHRRPEGSGPLHLDVNLTRSDFQRMTQDLLDRCKGPFEQAIKDAGIKLANLDHVILVGGSTRMPRVRAGQAADRARGRTRASTRTRSSPSVPRCRPVCSRARSRTSCCST